MATQQNGIITTDFGGDDRAFAMALQKDGKILVAGSTLVRYNSNGSIDASFGTNGKVTIPIGVNSFGNITVQPDGKILVAGGSNNGFAVVRYNNDGSLDTSFDSDGIVTTQTGLNGHANSVNLQADGKILVAGIIYNWSNDGSHAVSNVAVARYNINGSLDTSFDADGMVTTLIGSSYNYAQSVSVQADGKILAAGYSNNGSNDSFALVRYNSNGSLDSSFDTDGVTAPTGLINGRGFSSVIQADGKILVAGYSYDSNGNNNFALTRYNNNGSLDTTFDGDGIVAVAPIASGGFGYSVALQSDGKIIVAGTSSNSSGIDFALMRYNSNGSLDTTFDGDGIVITPIGSSRDEGRSVTVQADGKILVSGYSYGDTNIDFALVRYNPDGSLDSTFNGTDTAPNNPSSSLTSTQLAVLSSLKSSFDPSISHIAYNADVNDANLYAAGSSNSYLNGECVSYVKLARSDLNFGWGGGATLGSQAATSKGFHVDTAIPMIGSAFVITAGYTGADETYGHTGIVRDVTVQRVFTRGVLQYEYKLELRDSNLTGHHEMTTYSKNLDNFPNHAAILIMN